MSVYVVVENSGAFIAKKIHQTKHLCWVSFLFEFPHVCMAKLAARSSTARHVTDASLRNHTLGTRMFGIHIIASYLEALQL